MRANSNSGAALALLDCFCVRATVFLLIAEMAGYHYSYRVSVWTSSCFHLGERAALEANSDTYGSPKLSK